MRAPETSSNRFTGIAIVAMVAIALVVFLAPLARAALPFRQLRALEAQADVDLPSDWQVPGEFVLGRLMYPPARGAFGFGFFGYGDWTQGGTSWAVDYPRGDRLFVKILRRLTTIDARSVEQPVNPDDGDDIFDWPYLVVGLPGMWDLTDSQVLKIREYLLRGGFLLCDSFFGTREWAGFEAGMKRIFPDRPIIDLPDDHPIFHTLYDLDGKQMVPNWNALQGGAGYRADGSTPHWRGVVDDSGRVMVMIAFNNDLGDAYQWADDPDYPEPSAALGMRMGVNFVIYAMTH